MRSRTGVILAGLLTVMIAPIAEAQQPMSLADLDQEAVRRIASGGDPAGFGLTLQLATLSTFAFQAHSPQFELHYLLNGYRCVEGPSGYYLYYDVDIGAGLDIPLGALLAGVCVSVYDAAGDGEIKLQLYRYEQPVDSSGSEASERLGDSVNSGLTWDDGYTLLCSAPVHQVMTWDDVDGNGTFGNVTYVATVVVHLGDNFLDLKIGGVEILWARKISPAPATATFDDVPVGAFGFQHVEALAASGITAGCGGSNFCPDQPLTRVQMAVFLAKALGLHFNQ